MWLTQRIQSYNSAISPGIGILAIICLYSQSLIAPAVTPAFALTIGEVTNVSVSGGSSIAPQIAVAENGNVYIVWQESDGSQDILIASSTSPENGFGEPAHVTNDSTPESGARVATAHGRIFVVWFENDGEIYFVNSTADINGDAQFGASVNLSNNGGNSRNPQLAASGDNVYVVWEDDIDGSSIPDIFYAVSADGGRSFSSPINLSDSEGSSRNPRISIATQDIVYISWQDDTADPGNEQAILIRASVDRGSSFGDTSIVNNIAGFSATPDVLPLGTDELYLVWEDATGDFDIFLSKGTVSILDATLSFGEFVNVSDNSGFSTSPAAAVSGTGIVFVAWIDDLTGDNDVFISNSTDGGMTFSPPIALSSEASVSSDSFRLTILPSNDEDLYVIWRDGNVGNGDLFLSEITNGGHEIVGPINISDNDGGSQKPSIGVFDEAVYVTWHDNSDSNNEVLFLDISASVGEESVISIQSPSDENPKWGRTIQISGTTNGADTDTVSVEWGDGLSTSGISVGGSTWGPVIHAYNASAVGSNEITATLFDSAGIPKATSDPVGITVFAHATSLTIDVNPNVVVQGNNITVSGILTDTDDDVPIGGETIVFAGSGAPALADVPTDAMGRYSAQGVSPSVEGTLWSVQAIFSESSTYESSNSSKSIYDTAPTDAVEFTVPAGSHSFVDLTGFNTSITFDRVDSDTKLFVSLCDTPSSLRYVSIDLCFTVSLTEELASDTFAHITASYSGTIIPEGHSEEEIDTFIEAVDGFVDITESRDVEQQTVTGRTSHFSKIVVAVALHEDPAEGAVRKQAFVGRNELVFNELAPRTVSFDKPEYSIGSSVTVRVSDETVNLDDSSIDTLTMNVLSESDMVGIDITLLETGNDTALFSGNFQLDDQVSSSADSILRVAPGDLISGIYQSAARAPFRIIFDDITESGIVELNRFTVDPRLDIRIPSFDQIGDAYQIRLIDAQVGTDTEITVIMSYVNVDLRSDETISAGLFVVLQFNPDSPPSGAFEWIDITTGNPPHGIPEVDTVQFTVAGVTKSVGNFTIGHDVREGAGGGRGGGGVPRPGAGIILLDSASASVEQVDEPNNSGEKSGSRSTAITQPTEGTDVSTMVRTDSGTVIVRFESVEEGSGQLKVESSELSVFDEFFDKVSILSQDNDQHGIVHLDGVTYTTTGKVFDIDASSVNFNGKVSVTIPYDEDVVASFSDLETNVRLIHYNEDLGTWEDKTSSVDEIMNTVTGALDSLSPVGAAIIIESDIQNDMVNSITRVAVMTPFLSVSDTGQATLSVPLSNTQSIDQNYILLVQIVDESNIAQRIDWQAGSLVGNQDSIVSISWNDMEKGQYRALILLLTEMENPNVLSEPFYTDLLV